MAKSKKQITEYIKKFCELYSLDYSLFFYKYEGDDMYSEVRKPGPIFGENPIESKLPLLSELFGLTYEEILNTTDEGMNKWYNKYEFFLYLPKFRGACLRSTLGEGFAEVHLLKAIFGEKVKDMPYPERYDEDEIKERVIDTLKAMDKIMPGVYHPFAEMNSFKYETDQFCSFPDIGRLVRSLLEMISRAKELFFKAQKEDLEENEILEYNFLVTVLGLNDVASTHNLYYRNVVALRNVHREENYKDFYSYVRLRSLCWLYPWRAKEFVDDLELAQAYINEYAIMFNEFSEFAKKVGKFSCSFVWADEPFIKDDFSTEFPFADINDPKVQAIKEAFERDSKPYQKRTHIYIDKTSEELDGDEEYIEKYLRIVGSPKQGGITMPKRELPIRHWNNSFIKADFSRSLKHIEALGGKKND